ncbi:5'-3' exonuclease [Nigerium massiliense]|uniref:5'-3' exonuclease n=1 Tax=Nigerium massiliense TaxID=1522317 RepID=UPI00058DF836|nr:5'-3' exonuclease [Nigerium massiliense]
MNEPHSQFFDAASLFFRAFFGLPATLVSRDGRPVNAVRGLLDFLARFITDYSPERVACAWDNSWRPQWRVDLLPTYKAHRVDHGDVEIVPPELTAQVPLIRETLDALGLPIVGADGYEADDVIATLAERAPGPADVVTGDRDLFQLVDDDRSIRVLYVARGVQKHERVTDGWLAAKYGITGGQYVDFAVLRGDPSDGLPGVKGIGEKTAASLLAQHGDLEGIVAAADTFTPAVRKALTTNVDYLANASQVVACERDVDLPELDLTRPREPRDPKRFAELADELNLGGAAERILAALAG